MSRREVILVPNGIATGGNRFVDEVVSPKSRSQSIMRLCIVGRQFYRPTDARDSRLLFSLVRQCEAAIDVRFIPIGPDANRFVKRADGLVVLIPLGMNDAQAVVGEAKVGLQANRLAEAMFGFVELIHLRENDAKVVMQGREIAAQGDRRGIEADGLLVLRRSEVCQAPTQYVINPEVLWVLPLCR